MSQAFSPLVLEKLFGGQGTQIWFLSLPQKVPETGGSQLCVTMDQQPRKHCEVHKETRL